MRFIKKQGGGGFYLNQSHARPPTTHTQATRRWSNFGHKDTVRRSLLDEQFQLCCYSEIRPDELGLGYHIEHVVNKSQNPQRTFDYTNLAASALDSANDLQKFSTQGHETFGGHASGKQQSVDMARFVSCHQHDCRRFFCYLSDGRIVPAANLLAHDFDRADYTVKLLNLNSPYLVNLRRKWWDELDQYFQDHLVNNWSLPDLASVDLVPHNKCLSRFFSLTRQFFGNVAEQTLQQHSPILL